MLKKIGNGLFLILLVGILCFTPESTSAMTASVQTEIGVTFVEGKKQIAPDDDDGEAPPKSKPNGLSWGNAGKLPSMGEQQLFYSTNILGGLFILSFILLWKSRKNEVMESD